MSRVPAALRALVCVCVLASAAAAAGPERRMLEAGEAVAFRGVGRLNVAGTRFCTATLISETVIVTAAHCLYNPRSRARVPLAEIRFVAGLRLGETVAVRRVVRAVTPPDFAFGGLVWPTGVRDDLALLELAEPVPREAAGAFATGGLGADGAPLAIVSYARDRPQAPSIEAPCGLLARVAGAAALDCAVTWGASGAPVLAGADGDRRLVAVVSAMGEVRAAGRPVTLAALVGPWIAPLRAALAAAPLEE